jgi:hypothetical protein
LANISSGLFQTDLKFADVYYVAISIKLTSRMFNHPRASPDVKDRHWHFIWKYSSTWIKDGIVKHGKIHSFNTKREVETVEVRYKQIASGFLRKKQGRFYESKFWLCFSA